MKEKEYVERGDAKKKLAYICRAYGVSDSVTARLNKILEEIPAVDVRPLEPSRWVFDNLSGAYHCEKCGRASPVEDQDGEEIDCPGFCPNCGADMRGVSNG